VEASGVGPQRDQGARAAPDLRRAWLILAVVSFSSFQTAMSLSIIFVIFPALTSSFPGSSTAELSWVVNIFTIVSAATLVLGGVAGERFGRKKILIGATAVFSLASAGAAMAPTVGVLIAFRCVQALATAALLPTANTIVMAQFPPSHRGSAIATWSAVGAFAGAVGPSFGGFLIDVGSWRWAFWMNVPIGAFAVLAARKVIPSSGPGVDPADRMAPWPDIASCVALFAGVAGAVLGLVQSRTWGWDDWRTLAALVVGAALVAWVVARSRRIANPLLRLDLLRYEGFSFGTLSMAVYAVSFFGFQFACVRFLTEVWHHSIFEAGLLATPVFVATSITTAIGGRIGERVGYRWVIVAGSIAWAGACVVMSLELGAARDRSLWLIAVSIAGAGSGFLWGSLFPIIMRQLPVELVPSGAGTNQTVQRIGNSLGVAAVVSVVGATTVADADAFANVFLGCAMLMVVVAAAGVRGSRERERQRP
jgi:EmrB/QacA subfamily drug resistance transporter